MNTPNVQDLCAPHRTNHRPGQPAIRQHAVRGRNWLIAALIATASLSAVAQPPTSDAVAAQRTAMQKLNFLAGQWSGPATVFSGPGDPLHLTQTESVQFKLDGLVLLIEGAGHTADGKTVFRALATVSFDNSTDTYHFRAYNDGHYVDTALTVQKDGFSWGFSAGPARITNSMRLTDSGEWAETTDVAVGSNKPQRSVEMLLKRQP